MVPPWMLLEAGVPVCRLVQEPGQFVVTLPQAYHAGFSHGFNSAEAVNFMTDDWLVYGRAAARRYGKLGKEPVIDLDHILVAASQADYSSAVHAELARVVSEQIHSRLALRELGCIEVAMGGTMQAKAMGRSPPCAVCGRICHFGFVTLDLAEGIAATSPCNGSGGGGDVATGARAIEGDGWGKLRVTCTAHADDLCVLAEAGTTANRTRLVHYMRCVWPAVQPPVPWVRPDACAAYSDAFHVWQL